MALQLDLGSLSLAPLLPPSGVMHMGKDVLRCWPHEYDSDAENAEWASGLDWTGVCGQASADPKERCGFERFTMNYAYCALAPFIPSGTAPHDKRMLLFDAGRGANERKMRNFHAAFAYITHYPTEKNADLQRTLGVSHGTFIEQVVPTIYALADHMSFLDFNLRFWEWNHTEMFPERVTFVPDGFPITVCQSANRFVARLLRSGK